MSLEVSPEVSRDVSLVFALAVSLFLAVENNVANLVRSYQRWYVPVNVALTVALLTLAHLGGLRADALGLSAAHVRSGLAWGGASAAAVALPLLVAAAVPRLRPLLRDRRLAGLSGAQIAGVAFVRIPFGTVLWEEVAFRAVLLGAWLQHSPAWVAVAITSVVFGAWHIVPTFALVEANQVARGRLRAVAAGVLLTAGAGVILAGLRLVSGSLLAPAVAHLSANATGAIAAAIAWRQPPPNPPP